MNTKLFGLFIALLVCLPSLALICRFLVPFRSFPIIRLYTIAIIKAITKQILRICNTLL